ncbi:MAG: POTRA domain-containing protein, partial [Ignavibacteria bacterium]
MNSLPLLPQNTVQSKISRISLTGNEYFTNEQIQQMMVLKSGSIFTKEQFELDLKNLIRNYQKEGFLNSRIDKTEKTYNFDSTEVSLSIHLEEGKQVFIGRILFEGNKAFTTDKLLSLMFTKTGRILNTATLNQD